MKAIEKILVMGGGSAGLLTALAIKKRNPSINVRVVASRQRGTIGVGEGTVPFVLEFVHKYLGFDEAGVYAALDPVYKLGVRFDWGKRDYFDYTFSNAQHVMPLQGLSKVSGFYEKQDCSGFDLPSALMDSGNALPSRGVGKPDVPPPGQVVAWHLENHRFVEWLEKACGELGIKMIDAEVEGAELLEDGNVKGLKIAGGALLKADFFIDSSGFGADIIGKALEEPFQSFSDSLFCDMAVVGGWDREEGEPILPYTVSQTMESGWSWRIDHPERINRGYVFSSDHCGVDEAEKEFRSVNPKLGEVRLVKFQSGTRRRIWVGNVVGVGNAAGFVEPLEATAIMCACIQAKWLADGLMDCGRQPTPTMKELFNRVSSRLWMEIRDFLALHYRFNDKLDTPFWKRCVNETPLHGAEGVVEFYRENGPSTLGRSFLSDQSPFGVQGYYAHLIGMKLRCETNFVPSPKEMELWKQQKSRFASIAAQGMQMEVARKQLMEPETWKRMRA